MKIYAVIIDGNSSINNIKKLIKKKKKKEILQMIKKHFSLFLKSIFINKLFVKRSYLQLPKTLTGCAGSTTCVYHLPLVKHALSKLTVPRLNRSRQTFA